ncbi:phage tail domain-containing protein [Macrococcoides caseolyticum]|uniref:phage tail domain-containing protein n=1 Tax=Macrococcoides caseolyticum TaxID=69966 RepID=UPI001F3F6ECD|nr:phage tail domain-containing protein [Macrococcus caseolyticus]MCE4957722.1 phage tail family protein [Macrococcus caseolyticus]
MHSCTIYLDDVDIQTLGVFIDDSFSMPMFNIDHINSISIPGRPGELYYNDKPGPIVFKIPLYSISDDELERQNVMRRFKKLLIDNDGKSKVVKLKNSQEPDIYYNVRLSSSNEMDKDMHQVGEFELELTCYDGFGLSVLDNEAWFWGDNDITLNNEVRTMGETIEVSQITLTSNGSITFTNLGYNVRPIIKLKGSGTNIAVYLGDATFSIIDLTNDELVIDMQEYNVYLNGVMNLDAITSMRWLDIIIKEGTNILTVNGTNLNLTVSIHYREIYY